MYGAIYGDLVGSIYEYSQTKKINSINPERLLQDDSFYSDDTILTIAVLDAILNDKDYDKYLRKYIDEYKNYKPNFTPYFKTSFSPKLIKWSSSNKMGNSIGNGAMMRISPVGFMFDNEIDVIENARLATVPSHNSIEAITCSTIIALMIYYLKQGYTKDEVYTKLNIDIKYKMFTKFNTTCEDTINNCLYSFYFSNSFEESIRNTLLMGGDTDTNCAIVGSLAEACYGIDNSIIDEVNKKIPDSFVKILELSKRY